MIRRVFFTVLVFVLLWEVYVRLFPFSLTQHQWHDNIVKAENYILENQYNSVIIGSSLSCRLPNSHTKNLYNLSFGGQGVMDGIFLLNQADHLPDTVLIESNFILRPLSGDFQKRMDSKTIFKIKEKVQGIRSDKMPLVLFYHKLFLPLVHRLYLSIRQVLNSFESRDLDVFEPINDEDKGNSNLKFERELERHRLFFSKDINLIKYREEVKILQKFVHKMRAKGKTIVFFELPTHRSHMQLPHKLGMRQFIADSFPSLPVVPLPKDLEDYHTTDGLHLIGGISGKKYLDYLISQIR